jgi:hypothetical protein
MKRIKLTQGQVAIVDDRDFESLSKFKWFATWCSNTRSFYALRAVRIEKGRASTLSMHRILMGLGRGDKRHVDHANGVTLDNRRSNLRIVTIRQNNQNTRKHRAGRLVGATFHKQANRWMAQIGIDGKQIYLGLFPTEQAAHEKYLEALTNLKEQLA